MVLPVSGFLPVPLPMMIPFMGAQSLVIGKMFGEGFQYGKRKISAMPNEEFNKLTFEKLMSNAREEIKASIPTMNLAMQDMKPMVDVVVREFFNYITLVSKIITGTSTGENIFQKEGFEIGEWIAHQLGTHAPGAHDTTTTTTIGPVQEESTFKLSSTETIPSPGTEFTQPLPEEKIFSTTELTVKQKAESDPNKWVVKVSQTYGSYARLTKEHVTNLEKFRRSFQGGNNNPDLIELIYQISIQLYNKYGIRW